jgi:GT2 family glycosyltransferase
LFTAIIPVHNRADLLANLLSTIARQTVPFTETIVVDNASTDGADELARAHGCRVIPMHENAGFARAVNAGWKAAATEWVAILNSDVELDEHWLERLSTACGKAGFAAGTVFDAATRNTIDGTYDLVSRAACAWRAGYGDVAAAQTTTPIAIAPGTACLFRRGVLEQLNGYEESFESWLEDVDLGLRCVRRGFSGVFVPEAVAWHHGGATLGPWNPRMVRLISRNQLLLVSRHFDRALFRRYFWSIAVGQLLWGAVAARHGAFFAWLRGKVEGLRRFHFSASPSAQLESFLKASESEIRRRACDSYWRWYFRLTGQRSEAP